MIIPVLLSGGIGSRLWPISRELHPKQFISLVDEELSLLQTTIKRLEGMSCFHPPIIVCNEEHRFLVAEQMQQLKCKPGAILVEPFAKGTASAVSLAALEALTEYDNPTLLVMPVDHVIHDLGAFYQAIQAGVEQAEANKLVTFGITPKNPATNFGYIIGGNSIEHADSMFTVSNFVEKPNKELAEELIASENCFWNSGIFLFKAEVFQRKLFKYAPDILAVCEASYAKVKKDLGFEMIPAKEFSECRSDSVDYAVLEHTKEAVVVELDSHWQEICAWSTLWESGAKNDSGNVVSGDVLLQNASNCFVNGDGRLIVGIGIDNVVIVETPDAVLVANKDEVEGVQDIVNHLKQEGRAEAINHTCVYRPWGSYESLVNEARFQVKRIIVKPGATLSLQMHHHRAEHWTVVRGTALVTCGDKEFLLREDESNYIPIGHVHRLKNPGVIPLEVIEVQTGSYLGEDDIVRHEDNYGRLEAT